MDKENNDTQGIFRLKFSTTIAKRSGLHERWISMYFLLEQKDVHRDCVIPTLPKLFHWESDTFPSKYVYYFSAYMACFMILKIFTDSTPLDRVGHRVAMSVCVYVCV